MVAHFTEDRTRSRRSRPTVPSDKHPGQPVTDIVTRTDHGPGQRHRLEPPVGGAGEDDGHVPGFEPWPAERLLDGRPVPCEAFRAVARPRGEQRPHLWRRAASCPRCPGRSGQRSCQAARPSPLTWLSVSRVMRVKARRAASGTPVSAAARRLPAFPAAVRPVASASSASENAGPAQSHRTGPGSVSQDSEHVRSLLTNEASEPKVVIVALWLADARPPTTDHIRQLSVTVICRR
jgi:hypothetical protein